MAVYGAMLKELGAAITKEGKEQYADVFEGTLRGKTFKFRVHHNKQGEFTKIDWQIITREDLQDVRSLFDQIQKILVDWFGDIDKQMAKLDLNKKDDDGDDQTAGAEGTATR